jgi:hypothetical protein
MPVVNRRRMLSRCPASQVGVARPALPRVFLARQQMQWRYVQFANQPPKKLSPDTAATPLPAALPLFATGLGAMGLLGWRRKRKKAAAIAAA